tara:strand:+ start:277 stop:561 length:285 start_codon:yes stop_codon:yes gene_type:complete
MGGIAVGWLDLQRFIKGLLMSEEVKEHKQGKPWKIESVCDTYDEAFHLVQQINEMSARSKNKKLETKIKRRANGKFAVKVRLLKDERKESTRVG